MFGPSRFLSLAALFLLGFGIMQTLNEMTADRISKRFAALGPFLDEKQRRLLAGAEAMAFGAGGVECVAALVGMSPLTVRAGLRALQDPQTIEPQRVRRPGGGRKPTTKTDPTLLTDLQALVDPSTRGDPQSPLRWTGKSTRNLAAELNGRATKSAIPWWRNCCMIWATVCRPTASCAKARTITPTATRSSNTSMPLSRTTKNVVSR